MPANVRKQLRIGPGGLLYLMVASMIVLVGVYTQNNLLFWGVGLMIGGLAVSLPLALLSLRGVEVQRVPPTHGVAGEQLVLRYRIVNRKRWLPSFGLVIQEVKAETQNGNDQSASGSSRSRWFAAQLAPPTAAETWLLHVGPGQHLQAEAPFWPERRGVLRLEKVVVRTSFPFGIVARVATFDLPATVLVYPRLWRIRRRVIHRLFTSDSSGRRRVERAGGHEDFFGLRPYRPGDSLKTIDWRRSARTGELVSREMNQPSPPRVMVLLDLESGSEARGARSDERSAEDNPHGSALRPSRFALRLRRWWTGKPASTSRVGTPEANAEEDAAAAMNAWAAADPMEAAISLAASLICEAHFHGCQVGLVVAGAASAGYPVHHSLPHRTRMLESLSLLEPGTSSAQAPPPMWTEPTVVIHPGLQGDASGRARRSEQWSAMQMGVFAAPARDAHIQRMLGHRSAPAEHGSRRLALRENAPWN